MAKKTKSKAKAKPKTKAKKAVKKVAKKVAKKVTKKKSSAKKTVKRSSTSAKKRSASSLSAGKPEVVSTIKRIDVGDTAPEFTLKDQTGQTVSLSSYQGKNIVLYFYPKDDTPGCTKEACSFRDNLPTFEGANAVILGVSFDDANSHTKFISKYNLNFTLLSDSEKEVAKAYGVYVQKNMYGNISWGIERSTFVIDKQGKIAAAFRRVSVDGHTEEVLEILKKIAA